VIGAKRIGFADNQKELSAQLSTIRHQTYLKHNSYNHADPWVDAKRPYPAYRGIRVDNGEIVEVTNEILDFWVKK